MIEHQTRAWRALGSSPRTEPISATEIFKQLHETCRHAFGLYIGWFTFFITLNFLVLGWLADAKKDKPDVFLVKMIAWALIIFALLGIKASVVVKNQMRSASAELTKRLRTVPSPEALVQASLPDERYSQTVHLTMGAIAVLIFVWLAVIFVAF